MICTAGIGFKEIYVLNQPLLSKSVISIKYQTFNLMAENVFAFETSAENNLANPWSLIIIYIVHNSVSNF